MSNTTKVGLMEKGIYKHNILQVSCFPSELTMFFYFSLYRQGMDVGEKDPMVTIGPHISHGDPKGGIIPESSPEVHPLPNSHNC